jgi:hypothetical protein
VTLLAIGALVRHLSNPALPNVIVMAADSDPLTWLLNFGAVGVVLVCLMTGLLHTKPDYDRVIEEGKAKDRAIEALVAQLTNRTIPALADVSQAMAGQAASPDVALGERMEALIARAEGVLGDERST